MIGTVYVHRLAQLAAAAIANAPRWMLLTPTIRGRCHACDGPHRGVWIVFRCQDGLIQDVQLCVDEDGAAGWIESWENSWRALGLLCPSISNRNAGQ